MSLKTRGILVLVIGTILGVSLSVGGGVLARKERLSPVELREDQSRLLMEVMQRVKREYVEPVNDAELFERAIRGMVGDLDRHSAFLDADEFRDIRISTSGRYSGVGLEISEADDRIMVISPIDGTPAQRAGIETGDEIVEIDGLTVTEDGLENTIDRLRGPAGTPVAVRVRRDGFDDSLTFNLTRQRIRVSSVRHDVLDQAVGYLRLSQFIDTTAEEAARAIDEMMEHAQETTGNMLTGLVLDLRNNPGGILDSAVDVSDLFLDEGVIVSARGRTPESRFTRVASLGDILDGATMVVLVNGGSASGSEIVAGALQDHGRATIVGSRTFGKGLVQTVMPLSRGRAIKLTTSRYFTPSGDSINEIGVAPDVFVEGARGYPDQGLDGELDREHDAQLIEALEVIRSGRVMHSKAAD
jgi:carboxyl-terminal processing protease